MAPGQGTLPGWQGESTLLAMLDHGRGCNCFIMACGVAEGAWQGFDAEGSGHLAWFRRERLHRPQLRCNVPTPRPAAETNDWRSGLSPLDLTRTLIEVRILWLLDNCAESYPFRIQRFMLSRWPDWAVY